MDKKADIKRHARHILLKEIGGHGQNLIANSHIGIVGAGGLGAPVLLYLAAAGIGRITLIDNDIVDISNLQRQVLYRSEDIGKPKAECAKLSLNALDPNIEIIAHDARFTVDNADLLNDCDIIIDGSDNFETRFLLNRIAFEKRKILVSGALGRFDGQVSAFDFRDGNGPCYQCLIPQKPQMAENCDVLGVVGAICGIIGSIMALETIKIITNAGDSLFGRILIYDGLNASSRTLKLPKEDKCPICSKF